MALHESKQAPQAVGIEVAGLVGDSSRVGVCVALSSGACDGTGVGSGLTTSPQPTAANLVTMKKTFFK
jgi:hypothetical protein